MEFFKTTDYSDEFLVPVSAVNAYRDDSDTDSSFALADQLKRGFDVLASLVALVVFLIPGLIIALLIFLEDGHNPLFRQKRVGKDARIFTLMKFRSMRVDSENTAFRHCVPTTTTASPRLADSCVATISTSCRRFSTYLPVT